MEIEDEKEELRKSLGLSSLGHTFDNYKVLPGTQEALEAFKGMAEEGCLPLLLCYGGVGNGKTHLCEALSMALYKKGIRCKVMVWSDIVRQLKGSFDSHRESHSLPYQFLFNRIRSMSYLIIDDVGMGSSGSEWEWGEFEDLTRYRYHEMLFTVVVTNKELNELPPRVISRFNDPDIGRIVLNRGKDYRKRWITSVQ